jgi:hypothetical protein
VTVEAQIDGLDNRLGPRPHDDEFGIRLYRRMREKYGHLDLQDSPDTHSMKECRSWNLQDVRKVFENPSLPLHRKALKEMTKEMKVILRLRLKGLTLEKVGQEAFKKGVGLQRGGEFRPLKRERVRQREAMAIRRIRNILEPS